MKALGIMTSVNSTAALMVDGKIVAAGSEDRFVRQKSIHAYPKEAIEFCLKEAGIKAGELDQVLLPYKDFPDDMYDHWVTNYDATFSMEDKIREQHDYFKPRLIEGKKVSFFDIFPHKIIPERMEIIQRSSHGNYWATCLKEHLGISSEKIVKLDHHLSHVYYAIYSNPNLKDPSLIFCMEGYGGKHNGSIQLYEKGRLKELYATSESWIGRLYRYITLLLGMKTNEHEYKVMGLAPYASEYHIQKPLKIFRETAYVDGLEIKFAHKPKDMYFSFKEKLEPYRFDAIAGALQRYTEELISTWVRNAVKQTGVSDIMFTGGVAMNVKAMMEVMKMPEVRSLWVGGTSSDESLAMGVLFQNAHLQNEKISPLEHLYLGNEFSDDEIEKILKSQSVEKEYRVIKDPSDDEIALRLERGEIMGRFAGKAEFGARGLGNRSILANPAFPDVVKNINSKIKNRDFWMPFAPVILHERRNDYLVNPKDVPLPYMAIASETTALARKHLLGALHSSDYTARPQVIRELDNPSYYRILKAFERRTGMGALLNTSFNLHGHPIVHTPQDAIEVFKQSNLEFIILGTYLIAKS